MSSIEFENCDYPAKAGSPQLERNQINTAIPDTYLFRTKNRFQTIDSLDTILTNSSLDSKVTAQLGQPTFVQLRKTSNLNSKLDAVQNATNHNTLSSSDAAPFG